MADARAGQSGSASILPVRFRRAAAIVPLKNESIMISITDVPLKDAERTYQEFFRDEFRTQRLGSFGHWFGAAHFGLGLRDPVSQTTFRNLVNGLTPSGDKKILEDAENPERIALWRLDCVGPRSLSVLWAMSSGTWRPRLESIPLMAATDVLTVIHRQLMSGQKPKSPGDYGSTLSVTSCQGASHDQCPNLKVTTFVLTHGFLRDGSARQLPDIGWPLQKEFLRSLYDLALRQHYRQLIGPLQRVGGIRDLRIVGVPQELVRKFFFDPAFNRDLRFGQNAKPLAEMEMFAKWRAQGESLGWGVNEAKAFLLETNRQKYWADLKTDVRSKIHQSVQTLQDWKSSWRSSRPVPRQRQEENAHKSEVESHKQRH